MRHIGRAAAMASVLLLWTVPLPAALADAGEPAPAALGEAAPRAVDYTSVEPPQTEFDRLGDGNRPTLTPESYALVQQLGRVLVALALTITLIYLFFRLGLPRVMQLWLKQGEQTYAVRERVTLDGSSTLVRVQHEDGVQYLLGLSPAGVQLIDKLPPLTGGPLSTPVRARGPFAERLRQQDVGEEP